MDPDVLMCLLVEFIDCGISLNLKVLCLKDMFQAQCVLAKDVLHAYADPHPTGRDLTLIPYFREPVSTDLRSKCPALSQPSSLVGFCFQRLMGGSTTMETKQMCFLVRIARCV
ncbi:hypothetical protein TNCV_3917281 [Trichonephila clavipes]|nr:hypothetical protein TNCV_3917281 [Trichonephila clavipes]